jgi:hypothetical protein
MIVLEDVIVLRSKHLQARPLPRVCRRGRHYHDTVTGNAVEKKSPTARLRHLFVKQVGENAEGNKLRVTCLALYLQRLREPGRDVCTDNDLLPRHQVEAGKLRTLTCTTRPSMLLGRSIGHRVDKAIKSTSTVYHTSSSK